jgi:hypothetical protein
VRDVRSRAPSATRPTFTHSLAPTTPTCRAVETDLAAFERDAARPAIELGPVAALYGGELLAGFGLPEPAFEEWLRSERERLRALALDVLERWLAATGQPETARDALARAEHIAASLRAPWAGPPTAGRSAATC